MPLEVCLPSGKSIEVTCGPGANVVLLREELARILEASVASIEITHGGSILEDGDIIPDDILSVIIIRHSWLDDGSGHITDMGGCACVVSGGPRQASPINALCDVGFANGETYFEVEVVAGDGAWIGVCTKEGFAQGWKCKGLFFGGPGNLSNGLCGLRMGFGEPVKTGSIIGISLDLTDPETISFSVIQNGKMLGKAFEKCPRPNDAAVFPVVRAHSGGDSFNIALRPKIRLRPCEPPAHLAEGTWKLIEFTNEGIAYDVDPGATLQVNRDGNESSSEDSSSSFRLSFRVGNVINTIANVTRNDDLDGDILTLSPVQVTMMGIFGPLRDLRNQVLVALRQVTSWHVAQAGDNSLAKELHMCGNSLEMVFSVDDSEAQLGAVTNDALMKR